MSTFHHRSNNMKQVQTYGQKIRECQFCGQPGRLEQDQDLTWYVECSNKSCMCQPLTAPFKTKRSAVLAWNSRYQGKPVFMLVDNK